MNTPTPETDAEEFIPDMCSSAKVVATDFARKLERERDQLRKVCDELSNATRAEFGELNWRLDAYNQLPHVTKNPDIRKAEPGPARATKP